MKLSLARATKLYMINYDFTSKKSALVKPFLFIEKRFENNYFN